MAAGTAPLLLLVPDLDTRDLLAELLEFEGVACHPAASAMQAAHVLGSCREIVGAVVDTCEGYGYEGALLLRWWAELPSLRALPMVVLSASPEALGNLVRGISQVRVVGKPIEVEDLRAALGWCASGRHSAAG